MCACAAPRLALANLETNLSGTPSPCPYAVSDAHQLVLDVAVAMKGWWAEKEDLCGRLEVRTRVSSRQSRKMLAVKWERQRSNRRDRVRGT